MESNADSSGPSTGFSVELFVRSLAPHGAHERQEAIVDRIQQLEQDDRIDSVTCTVWGDRICPETAARLQNGRSLLRDIARLRAWAQAHDAILEPFFEERTVQSMCDDPYTVLVPPVWCLAVSSNEGLWGVFPCVKAGNTFSVVDGLDALAESTPTDSFADRAFTQP